ncbi:hypothetical protein [Montanilutibacter psychrotolerans]|uniref:Uncharacterized protein n=1 Tax=Montanilutibacter psychrotolerans TaxID=1327343 RepID=A0A3M8SKU8_9GAMM|nr:hypothetical protein [Lysobacter psychrotolerans]RNF81829.1 hypothetical protein EER27_16255 [Lysobacter psychrotolerans]
MRDDELPHKTDAGREEIRKRTLKLPNALRAVLLLVDGQRSVAQLRGVVAGLHGPANALDQLLAAGLIARGANAATEGAKPVPAVASDEASRYGILYTLMSETVRQHLGLRGYFLQLRIERCVDVAGLMALMGDLKIALAKAHGTDFAEESDEHLRSVASA